MSKQETLCPGCERSELLHLAPGEVERILTLYLRDRPGEPVADDVMVSARMEACRTCPDIQFGGTTCRHCGCLVAVRAKLAKKDCPAPVSRWNFEGEQVWKCEFPGTANSRGQANS